MWISLVILINHRFRVKMLLYFSWLILWLINDWCNNKEKGCELSDQNGACESQDTNSSKNQNEKWKILDV